jgi:hypothetical protein
MVSPQKFSTESYLDRVANFENPAARLLLECIDRKQSNLCVSVDVTTKAAVLEIMAAVGPYVCLVKVSIDTSKLVFARAEAAQDSRGHCGRL